MSDKRQYEVFAFVILFLVLNFQTCCGNYTCYKLSSGKDICFMLDDSQRSFEESEQFCKINGGFLLEIYNEEMQRLVEQFGKSKAAYIGNVWLNLVRTSNVWVWGGEGSDTVLSYSNWEGVTPASYDGSLNHAFMNSNYKWTNSYDSKRASTICIKGNSETYWLGSDNTSISTTTAKAIPAPTASSATTSKTTTTTDSEKQTNNFTSSITTSATTTTTTIFSQNTTTIFTPTTKSNFTSESSSSSSSSSTTTTTSTPSLLSPTSTMVPKTQPIQFTATESSSSAIGIGVGVGLGVLVLIIVSSLLIAKFVFHKEIPLPFKSSTSRNSPPHQTETVVSRVDPVYDGYEQIDENTIGVIQSSSGPRSIYAEVTAIQDPHEPPTKDYYYYNNNNNNVNNKKKVLEYADLGRSSPSNSMQEPERIAAPNGTLYTKTFEKKQNENLTAD